MNNMRNRMPSIGYVLSLANTQVMGEGEGYSKKCIKMLKSDYYRQLIFFFYKITFFIISLHNYVIITCYKSIHM